MGAERVSLRSLSLRRARLLYLGASKYHFEARRRHMAEAFRGGNESGSLTVDASAQASRRVAGQGRTSAR